MKIAKKLALLGLAVAMAVSLAACGDVSKKDVAVFIQGELDATYLGQYNEDYLKLMDMTAEELEEQNYIWNLEAEAELFMKSYGMEETDETTEKVVDLFKEIYSHSKYEVQTASKLENGSYAVEVLVEPIDVIVQFDKQYDVNAMYSEILENNGVEDPQAMTDEQYLALESEYADAVISAIRDLLPNLGYGKQQSAMLQLKLEGNTYTLVETDWQKLDDMILDFYGSYTD